MSSDEPAPTGLPDDEVEESEPLGVPDPDPDAPASGEDAMPGIPSGGEPPTSA
jgi:hypothetical protein